MGRNKPKLKPKPTIVMFNKQRFLTDMISRDTRRVIRRHWCLKGNPRQKQLLRRNGRYSTRCHRWCQPLLLLQVKYQQATATIMFNPSSIGNFLIEKIFHNYFIILCITVWCVIQLCFFCWFGFSFLLFFCVLNFA